MDNRRIFQTYRDIIPQYDQFCDSLDLAFPVHLRINGLKVKPDFIIKTFEEKGIFLKPTDDGSGHLFDAHGLKSPGNMLEYFSGFIHPQAFTSCLASLVLSPEPGSYVLDMCSSPGGKTSHLAQIMGNRGLIVANEFYLNRHIPLSHTLSRLGVVNTILTAYQAQEFPRKHLFDYILADVPCSGEGRFRNINRWKNRHWDFNTDVNPRLMELQRRIVLRGYDLLKEGGEMLYATCTYNPDENESAINYLLENRDARLLPITISPGGTPGLTRWRNKKYDGQLEYTIRFYPHRVNSVGFFMARIGK